MAVVISTLLGLGYKLMVSSVIEKVVLIGLRELVKSSKSAVCQELYDIVDKQINEGK